VGYLLTFAALAWLIKRVARGWAILLLAIALPLLCWDVRPHWQRMMDRLAYPAQGDLVRWDALLADAKQINLHPAFGCEIGDIEHYFFFQGLAAHFDLTMDSGYIARANLDYSAKRLKLNQSFESGQLYVLVSPFLVAPHQASLRVSGRPSRVEKCSQWRHAFLCKPGMKPADWQSIPLKLQSTERYLPAGCLQCLADNLSINIGTAVADELVPARPDAHDFLSFGPYVALPSGRYRAWLEYRSKQPAGIWDAVAAPIDGAQRRVYGEGTLAGD